MVRGDAQIPDRADGSVRLVQDFGRPGDPAAGLAAPLADPAAPLKRGRGRPRGSRTKKAA
jgi:hypothetical protein